MAIRAFITGLSGLSITPDEASFLRETQPWGLIVFRRNIADPQQLLALTQGFRDILGRDAPVLVDQEGGRVQRLGPPHWPAYPAGAVYGLIYEQDRADGLKAARLGASLIAADLRAVGIDVDCLPLADLPVEGADAVIGDRAYGTTPGKVAAIAGAVGDALLASGVLPVLKHLPGHGRATADSHLKLPVVETDRKTLEKTDFAPFRALSGLPMGMTAHVVFSAIDPVAPATTSAIMVDKVIRQFIGFSGLLMGDDVSMGALSGSIADRARASLQAGCDMVLHCNGNLAEMTELAAACPVLEGKAAERAASALSRRITPRAQDLAGMRADFARLIGTVDGGALSA
jgi:beta-N-acetylhexosaminidase